ncbi:MAG: efflux RND transporter permease subunit, partial [Vicinamibacterales bacterium]|nr:efflux RND transporter permease subunit [Vicinamibacterales bacterium]
MTERLGISGRLARLFLDSELTPLLGLTALLLGLFAVAVTPREEEPQINVTMANVIVPFPGASAAQVESLVATPMEKVLAEISGVKHIYSVSRPGAAVITVQFEVGEERTEAIVRLYNAIYSNQDWRPPGVGILQPLVKPKGIDDVPVLALTLWTKDPARGAHELRQVAHAIEAEIKRVPGTRNVDTIGGPDETVHVALDPQRLAGYGLTVSELIGSLQAANVVQHSGATVADGRSVPVQAGQFLADRDEVAGLVVAVHEGRPVYLQDVAEVRAGPDQPEQYVSFGAGPAAAHKGIELAGGAPAVTIAVSKKPGENAIDVTRAVLERVELLRGTYIPEGVEVTVTRDYGETANDKALKLIQKLMFATASVVLLVWLTVGWREAVVVGAAVVITLAATLFASWAWGFTINRVSLFALIFAIGILVDDAIVVVENIHRHMGLHPRRGRGGRAHDPGHLHRDRGAAADGLRLGADGPVHEPDPDQRQPRHAHLARDRAGVHALAVEAHALPLARGARAGVRGLAPAGVLRARDVSVPARRRRAVPPPQALPRHAGRHRAGRVAGRRAVGGDEDAALRQQVGVPGGGGHARGHGARGDRPRARRAR